MKSSSIWTCLLRLVMNYVLCMANLFLQYVIWSCHILKCHLVFVWHWQITFKLWHKLAHQKNKDTNVGMMHLYICVTSLEFVLLCVITHCSGMKVIQTLICVKFYNLWKNNKLVLKMYHNLVCSTNKLNKFIV